jgi:hypothetical protein
MSHPPYHLRTNKTADRFALIEAIRRLERLGGGLQEYIYYGLGGPCLEDMRLLYEFYPEIPMISIEEDEEICKRQEFHRPCSIATLQLENNDMKSYITLYESNDKKSIFWLDYTAFHYTYFNDFTTLLGKTACGSMVKITLRVDRRDYWYDPHSMKKEQVEEFQKEFASVLPTPSVRPSWISGNFAYLVQRMLQIASEQALPAAATKLMFYPVSSFYYSDGTWMFTLTGVIWPRDDKAVIERAFGDWEFANLTWARPKLIDIPDLSTKERLLLQQLLPCSGPRGATLRAKLDYLINENILETEAALEQYAAFHRYFPYFLRGIP